MKKYKDDEIDVIASSLEITPERARQLNEMTYPPAGPRASILMLAHMDWQDIGWNKITIKAFENEGEPNHPEAEAARKQLPELEEDLKTLLAYGE